MMEHQQLTAKSRVSDSQIYDILTSLVMHSEQVRWTRLNAFLVLGSIFLAAWAGVFAGTESFKYKEYLLLALCVPGIVLGLLWARLGWRSSEYMDDFHDRAYGMEEHFKSGQPRPFHISEERRTQTRTGIERFTSSKWFVTVVPLLFSLLFLILIIASFSLHLSIQT